MSEHHLEAPEADAAEQDALVTADDADDDTNADGGDLSDEVDPADRAEQQRDVGLGDDEYR
jgi:hypothetical protein